jgi:hypothetical protein
MYTYDVVGFERNNRNIRYRMKHTTSYVHAKTYAIVYDDKHQRHRIRCTFQVHRIHRPDISSDPTSSWVTRDDSEALHPIVRPSLTYDVVGCTYDIVRRRTMSYMARIQHDSDGRYYRLQCHGDQPAKTCHGDSVILHVARAPGPAGVP